MNTYNPTPNVEQPGIAYDANGNHFGLPWANPEGSAYATAYSRTTTDLLQKIIAERIFDTTNEQYKALWAFMYNKPIDFQPSDEFNYKERGFQREALTVHGWNHTTGVITLAGTYTDANDIPVTVGDVICLPVNNRKVRVSAISHSAVINSSTITVVGLNGSAAFGASDVVAADILSLQSALFTDGMNAFNHYDRVTTTDRYNYIQLFHRARRWGIMELKKYENTGTTDYLMHDKENTIEQLRADLFCAWLNGTRGEFSIAGATSGNYFAKTMNGVYPTMVAAGAPSASVTTSGLQAAFEALAFQTNRLAKGKTRFILATDEMLHELAKVFKNPIQYTPNDKVANLGLNAYEFGTMRFVPVPVPQMGDTSMFPEFFGQMLLTVDMDSMQPVCMKGLPQVIMQENKTLLDGGNQNMYKDFYCIANLSMKFNAPNNGFIINVL